MKIKKLFLVPALIAALDLAFGGPANAQTFTNLRSFGSVPGDGLQPTSGLVLSSNILYGTTDGGGTSSNGAIFSIHADGTGYTNLYNFSPSKTNSSGILTNSDGANPGGGQAPGSRLVVSGNTIYGTAFNGGPGGTGTIFKLHTDGSGFANLHSFTSAAKSLSVSLQTNSDGAAPDDDLLLSGNTLYGTTLYCGSSGTGLLFAISTEGTNFTVLHAFSSIDSYTNSDGAFPVGSLVLLGGTIYGTTDSGGIDGAGTVYAVNTASTAFTNLHSFGGQPNGTNYDGLNADGGLVSSGAALYGTTAGGGSNTTLLLGGGTVYKINNDGTGFTTLHSFDASSGTNSSGLDTNSGGLNLFTSLTISGSTLYGAAQSGGSFGSGTLFVLNTDGTGFTTLYNFAAVATNSAHYFTNSDGAFPYGSLTIISNSLFGVTTSAGIYGVPYLGNFSAGDGTLFSFKLPQPQLSITRAATNVILTWPTNFPTFSLQSATNLVLPVSWSSVSPGAVIVGDQNTVTNSINSSQKFYRLSE